MENHNVIITGFDSGGILKGPVSILKEYSFGAYRDPSKRFPTVGTVTINDQNNQGIACYSGQGNHPVHPGAPSLEARACWLE
jgi:hypothetical protein